jgi:hypothetical protein
MEAMRALKRRLSGVVYRQMAADAERLRTGPAVVLTFVARPGANLR